MSVELDVSNSEGLLSPGMYPEVTWMVRSPSTAVLVPPASVVTTTEHTFVVRVRNGRAERVNVRKGAPSGDLVEVLGPLKPGDVVVSRATDEIREGQRVQVSSSK